jgi:cell division protein FtsL
MNPLMLLLLSLLPIAAFVVGVLVSRSRTPQLTSAEKKELKSYRDLVSELTSLAGEHSALGDNFAVIALQKINEHRKELS